MRILNVVCGDKVEELTRRRWCKWCLFSHAGAQLAHLTQKSTICWSFHISINNTKTLASLLFVKPHCCCRTNGSLCNSHLVFCNISTLPVQSSLYLRSNQRNLPTWHRLVKQLEMMNGRSGKTVLDAKKEIAVFVASRRPGRGAEVLDWFQGCFNFCLQIVYKKWKLRCHNPDPKPMTHDALRWEDLEPGPGHSLPPIEHHYPGSALDLLGLVRRWLTTLWTVRDLWLHGGSSSLRCPQGTYGSEATLLESSDRWKIVR